MTGSIFAQTLQAPVIPPVLIALLPMVSFGFLAYKLWVKKEEEYAKLFTGIHLLIWITLPMILNMISMDVTKFFGIFAPVIEVGLNVVTGLATGAAIVGLFNLLYLLFRAEQAKPGIF